MTNSVSKYLPGTSLFPILALVLCFVTWSYAQEPAAAPEPPSWTVKLNAALTGKTALTLTAEEARALAESYTAALNARPRDLALSATACYVIGTDGTVIMNTMLP